MLFHSPIIGRVGGSVLRPQDVFATSLYTGNGSSQTITNGIDLSTNGGMVWTKARDSATRHYLHDTARGTSKPLQLGTSSTAAQNNLSPYGVSAFSTTGFTVNDSGAFEINTSATTYVGWSFRRAPKFFDVVTYTGTGANRTIAHGLGVDPGLIIVKCTNTGSTNWQVYHRSVGATKYLILNVTNAETTSATSWNNTAPTASVFSLGSDSEVNFNGWTYVAYLFAHDTAADGIVQCGGFVDTATVTLGWQPQFLLVKNASSTGNWNLLDTSRGLGSGNDAILRANTSAAEDSSGDFASVSSTGFTSIGFGTGTFVYLAIRAPI